MALDNQSILFASLMGSSAVEQIQRLNIVNNELDRTVLPVIPFIPVDNNETTIAQAKYDQNFNTWAQEEIITEEKQFFPLSFSFTEGGQRFTFPYEPLINISSGNNIVKRNVAKQNEKMIGTVKERWSRKDFEIQVTGVLIGSKMVGNAQTAFPRIQMIQLFDYLKHSKEIYVYSYPLSILGINKIVVEDYSFPFTKGENVQAYDIKLVSDYSYNLLIKETDL